MDIIIPIKNSKVMDWEHEAKAVMDDVRLFVNKIEIATSRNSDNMRIYFDIETLERAKFTVAMDSDGFSICDNNQETRNEIERQLEDEDQQNRKIYETIYALLDDNSVEYRKAFAQALMTKVDSIRDLEGTC